MGFVVWEISGHFWGVYQSHYCASAVAFLFSFVYLIYLNIASYLYGKQIKSKLWTKLYLWLIFICVRLNRLHFHECRPMPLKSAVIQWQRIKRRLPMNVNTWHLVPSCWHKVGPTFTFVKLAHCWQVHVGPTYRTLSGQTHDGSMQGQQVGLTLGQHVGPTLGQHLRQTSYVPE